MPQLRILAALSLICAVGCWGPIDKGKPGVGTKITPQGHGAEWIKLRTELDGKSPVAGAPASTSEASGAAAPASAAH